MSYRDEKEFELKDEFGKDLVGIRFHSGTNDRRVKKRLGTDNELNPRSLDMFHSYWKLDKKGKQSRNYIYQGNYSYKYCCCCCATETKFPLIIFIADFFSLNR